MKLIVKIEIIVLIIVVLVGAGVVMAAEGVFELLYEPVIAQREAAPLPTDAPVAPVILPEPVVLPEKAEEQAITRDITADNYFAYDIREDVYLAKQGDSAEKLYPASITKLLTSYVVLQHMDPEETVEVGDALNLVQPDSSVAKLQEGDELTVSQLIAGMLLPSGNDASQAIAVATGRKIGGSNLPYYEAVDVFVEEMNRQAERLGMVNSHFANPDGFHDSDHYTTMDDLVVLCKAILADPVIMGYTSRIEETVEVQGRTLEWENTNILLHSGKDLYHANAMGMKTGYTSRAGNCLISAFFEQDRVILIGVFGCPGFTEDHYYDTVAIYESL